MAETVLAASPGAALEPLIEIADLSFRYAPELHPALESVQLAIGAGERCLLVGANGAGKTTLLRVLGGHHLVDPRAVLVLGRPAFHDTSLAGDVALLGGSFPFTVDVRVRELVAGRLPTDRCRRLIELLGVDLDWRMNRISDGQRRRVQLLLGLAHPSRVLLLDEITTDLDLLGRADLLEFLREESESRGACILYATHIFDRLESWATHLAFLDRGRVLLKQPLSAIAELEALQREGAMGPLAQLCERWMRRCQRAPGSSAEEAL